MIVYTSANGQVIGFVSATDVTDLQGITRLPSGADYAVYVADGSNPNTGNLPGTYTVTGIVAGHTYTVPTATGTLTFTEQPASEQLANAQHAQIAILEAGLNATLAGGFTAKTLVGTATNPHTYPTTSGAQANFTGVIAAFTANPNKTTANILTLDAGWISHTKAEFYGVFADGDNWKEAQFPQLASLAAQVEGSTTVAGAQSVTWTPATY